MIVGAVAALYAVVRRWTASPQAAGLAAAALAVGANLHAYCEGGNLTEIYVLLPATLSMYFFSRGLPEFRARRMFLSGCAAGVAALFKPPGLAPVLAQGAFVLALVIARRAPVRTLFRCIFWTTLGLTVAWLPAVMYFGHYGAVGALLEASFLYNVRYGAASQPHLPQLLHNAARHLSPVAPLVFCAVICLIAALRSETDRDVALSGGRSLRPLLWLNLLWIAGDLAGSLAGGRHYGHYFLPMIPSLSASAGLAYAIFFPPRGEADRRLARLALVLLVVGPIAMGQAVEAAALARPPETVPGIPPWDQMAARLRAEGRPGDTLFVWDYLPGIYFQSGLSNADLFLDASYRIDYKGAEDRFGFALLQRLKARPPTFFVRAEGPDAPPLAAIPGPEDRALIADVDAWLNRDFVKVAATGSLKLYRHKTDND